jgi:hypothetical protein
MIYRTSKLQSIGNSMVTLSLCGSTKKTAESSRTPPFLPEHHCLRTKAVRLRNYIGASIHWTDRTRGNEPARVPHWHFKAARGGLTMNLATNQRAKRRDRTNVYMCHLDHLLQLPWA